MPELLLEQFQRHERLALSRLLSQLAHGQRWEEIQNSIEPAKKTSRVVAITGSGGVGKSTLIGKLIDTIRKKDQTVAVLACDPQSPRTGGALLGDRFRMPSRPDDDGVFIRSLAAASGHGAIAENLDSMIRLLQAFGFDVVLIETVGAGQGDTEVSRLADVTVLLVQPVTGDELQWEKAGVFEVADIVVVHKADLPGAEMVESQIRDTLALSEGVSTVVLSASAKMGAGIEQLWSKILEKPLHRQ